MKASHLISVLAIWLVFLSPLVSVGVGVDAEEDSLLIEQGEIVGEIDNFFEVDEASTEDPEDSEGDEDPEDDEDPEEDEDDDDDDIDDDFEESNERSIEVEFSEEEAVIVSKLRTGDQKDEIKMKLKTEDYFEIKVEYKRDTETSELEVEFEIVFTALVEFVDENNDSVYSSEDDTLIQQIPLNSFQDISYLKTQINATTYLHYFQITTNDSVLTFHVYFVEEFHLYNEVLLVPTQSKIDIEIANFNYTDSQSQLGLLLNMESEVDYDEEDISEDEENGFSSDEQWLETSNSDIAGFFSWNKLALIDSAMHNVSVEVVSLPGENEQQISIFYPRGTNIYHDPKIGVAGILQPAVVLPPPGAFFSDNLSLILIIVAGLIGIFGLIMSKQEYRDYLLNRVMHLETRHRLSMEEVLENEFRIEILNLIIDQPGIHYSELLRLVDTSSSNLAWHLDILEQYKIIAKKRVGRFLIFYPYLDKNPFAEFDPKLVKSKTTLDIFQIIGDNPGIIQARIAKRMELNRKTISYHLDKLNSAGLIIIKKVGRKTQIYPRSLPKFGEEQE